MTPALPSPWASVVASLVLFASTPACTTEDATAPDGARPAAGTPPPSPVTDSSQSGAPGMVAAGAAGVGDGAAGTRAGSGGDGPGSSDAGGARPMTYPGCVDLPDAVPASTRDKIDPAIRTAEKADIGQLLVVQLRDDLTPPLPACESGESNCAAREQAALERMSLHQEQLACVLDITGSPSGRVWWWDAPVLLSSGDPTSRQQAYGVVLLGRDVEKVASHPFVAGISLPPDLLPPSDECPAADDADAASKVDATTVAAATRGFAIVSVNRPFECDDCQDLRVQQHTHILSTRLLTCLFQHIKRVTGAFDLLQHAGGDATPGQPHTSFQREFAVPLDAQQAREVARHPYVKQIVLTDTPIPEGTGPMDELHEGPCPEANDSVAGKIDGEEQLAGNPGPHACQVGVKGGGDARALNVLCPSKRPCPERETAHERLFAAHRESQRCVRAFLDELGAEYSDAVLFGNAFSAQLTSQQIMRAAAHPHVQSISVEVETPPP